MSFITVDSDCLDGDEVRWVPFERLQAERAAHPWDAFTRAFFFRAKSHEEVGRRNFRALVPGHGWKMLGEDWISSLLQIHHSPPEYVAMVNITDKISLHRFGPPVQRARFVLEKAQRERM